MNHVRSSSSSSLSLWEHDVFLSFRGEDTRNSFTDHLYRTLSQRGINTFRDAEKLQKGNSVLPTLVEAIRRSRCAVIVLSANYASSTWCLNELVHILECNKVGGSKLEVFPVFYNVEPSEVRKQTGVYGEALSAHEDLNKVDIWKNALTEVANFSGWDVKNRSESEVTEEIAEKISNILKFTFPTANDDLIGMNSRIEKVESYLDLSLDVVRTIGISGMGGIGKTTLAQEVFKKILGNFDTNAFVANVREKSGNVNGLVDLQKSLYKSLLHSDVDIHSVDMGKYLLRRGLRSKKVLIILDDVHELKQMEALAGSSKQNHWFGPGSRVIITTRDEQLLKSYDVHKTYEVEKLNDAEASQLLCQKAFKKNHAPTKYLKLCNNFVKYASGLPLALEVLGSYLCRKEVSEWSAALARLYEDPEKDILRVLQLSYNGLKSTVKDMFLDIACFFRGEEQDRVMKIFTSCDFHPEIGIVDLIDKSLIKIEGKKLWMHDLLQQMGWQIVRQESPKEPGKRSRLWLDENACEYERWRSWFDEEQSSKCRRFWLDKDARAVLIQNLGTEHVEGLFLSLQAKEELHLNADPFYKMPNLRLLKIYNVNFAGCIELISLSQNLRLLEWHEFPLNSLPSSFRPNVLAELKMPNSRITQLWSETLSAEMLMLMDLSNCQYLTRTPDFSTVPKLERLILEGCKRLSEVHPTVGGLKHLVLLNLKGCESVESLPDSISLESLQTLVLSGCLKIKKFPEIMGNMENMSELYLDGTAIQELPISLKHLSGLSLLNLRGCKNLSSLPSFICSLTSLISLNLSGCSLINQLPEDLGSLEHLQEVDACETSITKVPSSILVLLLKNLKRLCFRGCNDLWLPAEDPFSVGFWSLTSKCLNSSNSLSIFFLFFYFIFIFLFKNKRSCDIRSLEAPLVIERVFLKDLAGLSLSRLTSLSVSRQDILYIPDEIGLLNSLQRLDLSVTNLSSIPESVCELSKLRELCLYGCIRLRSLPKYVPLSLKFIDARYCSMLTNFPNNCAIWASEESFSFMDCRNSVNDIEDHVNIRRLKYIEDRIYHEQQFEIHLRHSRIPDWCGYSRRGSSVTIPLSDPEDGNSTWMGFVLFVAFEILDNRNFDKSWELKDTCCHFSTYKDPLENPLVFRNFSNPGVGPFVLCCYVPQRLFSRKLNRASRLLRASISTERPDLEVKECGIQLISQQGAALSVQDLTQTASDQLHQLDSNFVPPHIVTEEY
ncbi:disease resistance protein RUN1-like [Rosa rugosa]|uniref:disease resistance protein RUN1-like n=1 Tax=Rosa rugosa TaxID=74645 RepID=UPI002B4062C8|nr:disease resistance protein RUN1-like [Rosa rugosa]